MSSRKLEEKNEKIIRGLMKLPPNRRCINCNSLGPQYVCTNFCTFVCTTCSGIHREFTHRVKSVSMSKFTSQEVEALQEGGNQRARETYLKNWDIHQRLPDSSNAEKVREFIKNVYVDRIYSGKRTSDKPPRDMQNQHLVDETRRASSYHSFSQSPPYDYQYEERRYGKLAPALTRKPGSDRGMYEGKISSFSSPSRLSDHDRSSGLSSPISETSRDILREDLNGKKDAIQETRSSGSIRSLNKSTSFTSAESVNREYIATAEPSVGTSLPQSSKGSFKGSGPVSVPVVPETGASTTAVIDLFQLPEASSILSTDIFHPTTIPVVQNSDFHQKSQTFLPSSLDLFSAMPHQQPAVAHREKPPGPSSLDLFSAMPHQQPAVVHSEKPPGPSSLDLFSAMPHQQPAVNSEKPPGFDIQKDEGWATFDFSRHVERRDSIERPATVPFPNIGPFENLTQLSSVDTSSGWLPYKDPGTIGLSSMPNPTQQGFYSEPHLNGPNNMTWTACDKSIGHASLPTVFGQSNEQLPVQDPSIGNQFSALQSSENHKLQQALLESRSPLDSQFLGLSDSSAFPFPKGAQHQVVDRKSSNPFDLPCDTDFESSNMFLDMSSLQAALPDHSISDHSIPNSVVSEMNQSWFPLSSDTSYAPAGPHGILGFMAGQGASMHALNVPIQGAVASTGRNPFE